jgi:hypothetical protein
MLNADRASRYLAPAEPGAQRPAPYGTSVSRPSASQRRASILHRHATWTWLLQQPRCPPSAHGGSEMDQLVPYNASLCPVYEAMCAAIAMAYRLDEVKVIADQAAALREYARQSRNFEAERQLCQIRLRAERKMGDMLAKMEKAKAGRPPGNPSSDTTDFRGAPTLAELGITRDQSSRWQRLAEVPIEKFEAALVSEHRLSTNKIIRPTDRTRNKTITIEQQADLLLDRLLSIARSLIRDDLAEIVAVMTPEKRARTRSLAALVEEKSGDLFDEIDAATGSVSPRPSLRLVDGDRGNEGV